VFQSATMNGAMTLHEPKGTPIEFGVVRSGLLADMVIVDQNPLENLKVLDVAARVEYLNSLGYDVDTARVGVWGLSYGGFLTLQALTVTPQLFACGIDVAGVDDWRDWYRDTGGSAWIKGRMGSPTENEELYLSPHGAHRARRSNRPTAVGVARHRGCQRTLHRVSAPGRRPTQAREGRRVHDVSG